jgi:integrase/recombinase XerD
MSLGKQAKTLNKKQIDQLLWYVGTLRHAKRNELIVLLSVRAGLRAKEIAELKCLTSAPAGQI